MPLRTTTDRDDPLRKALTHGLALWAVVAPLWVLVTAARRGRFALDFHYAYLPAAHAVLHGASPYSGYSATAVGRDPFVYPPLGAYLLAPFTLLSPLTADILATVLVAAAVLATLFVLGVRDWRCYAIAFLWWPTIIGIQTANITLLMVLAVALVWRFRDRPVIAALVTALAVAAKLLFWPLIVWLVATRRYRAALASAAATALLVVVPWAGLGFVGFRTYPHLLSRLSDIEGPSSYSLASLLHDLWFGWTAATVLGTVAGLALLIAAVVLGRRGRERDSFALVVAAALIVTPLLQMTYVAALLVIVALYRRRLDVAWLLPLLIWGASAEGPVGSALQVVHVLGVGAATVFLAMSEWRPRLLERALGSQLPGGDLVVQGEPGRAGIVEAA